MDKKTMVMKYFVCIVILLLVGTALTPSIDANIGEESEHKSSKTHPIKTYYILSNETKRNGIFERSFSLSPPEIKRIGKNIEIQTHEETSKIVQPNKPVLPVVTRVFLFPFKTKIKGVTVNFYGKKEVVLSSPLSISSEKSPITSIEINSSRVTKEFIDSIVYPEKQYNYHMNAGRYDNNIANYLSINLFPVQYDSLNMVINYWNKANISISYEVPEKPTILDNKYDLIIIAPLMFYQEIKPLVEHKNAHGIKTKLVTLNEIYLGLHFPVEGRDKAENIKYFLKHAFDEWGIKYVLFTGGRKGGLFNPWWWVPVRYSNIVDFIEYSYLSDLYFVDLYDAEGNFSTWDSNENDIFAEWNKNGKDIIDMYPEISVGRLPCKSKEEVTIMVNKIITYENTAYGEKWFKKFIGVAGDTFPEDDSYYEGELSTEAAYGYLDGFEATYLWTSTGNFTGKQDVLTEVNEGCGLMLFSGHSDPHEWSNHPPNKNSWIDAPNSFEMDEYQNKEKLPIVIVSGCWISKFDTGLMNMLKGIITERLEYFRAGPFPTGIYTYDWIPNCWSWSMCSQTEGGCIAIIGGTGLGYGIKGKNCLNGGIIFLELQFFKSYGEGRDILGETHIMQLIYYMNEYPPMEAKTDCKHIQEFALLGDPSLKIGGYP